MSLSRFQESLLVLGALKNNIQNDLRVIKRYSFDEDLKFSLTNKMLIDIASFLDEWKRFNTYAKESDEIKETMRITSPAVRRLKQWRGIKGMRNTMLAHGFRDDNAEGRVTDIVKRYFDADVPTTYAEIMLLSEFVVYTISTAICRHESEYEKALVSVPQYDQGVQRGIQTMEELDIISF